MLMMKLQVFFYLISTSDSLLYQRKVKEKGESAKEFFWIDV